LPVPDSNSDKIPQETYNYVFYSVSAAVIGENPRFLVFKFESPLSAPEQKGEVTEWVDGSLCSYSYP
jgi:hypothetical protein